MSWSTNDRFASKLVKLIKSMADMQEGEKIAALTNNPILQKLIEYNSTGFDLPEGMPEGIPIKYEDMTNIYAEARRLYIFTKNGVEGMKASKKEQMFLDMVQGLCEDEGKILIAVKDKKLFELYPQLELQK